MDYKKKVKLYPSPGGKTLVHCRNYSLIKKPSQTKKLLQYLNYLTPNFSRKKNPSLTIVKTIAIVCIPEPKFTRSTNCFLRLRSLIHIHFFSQMKPDITPIVTSALLNMAHNQQIGRCQIAVQRHHARSKF